MHQAAGGVVDIDQQRALQPAILEPPVLGTVDLYQFAGTIGTIRGTNWSAASPTALTFLLPIIDLCPRQHLTVEWAPSMRLLLGTTIISGIDAEG